LTALGPQLDLCGVSDLAPQLHALWHPRGLAAASPRGARSQGPDLGATLLIPVFSANQVFPSFPTGLPAKKARPCDIVADLCSNPTSESRCCATLLPANIVLITQRSSFTSATPAAWSPSRRALALQLWKIHAERNVCPTAHERRHDKMSSEVHCDHDAAAAALSVLMELACQRTPPLHRRPPNCMPGQLQCQ